MKWPWQNDSLIASDAPLSALEARKVAADAALAEMYIAHPEIEEAKREQAAAWDALSDAADQARYDRVAPSIVGHRVIALRSIYGNMARPRVIPSGQDDMKLTDVVFVFDNGLEVGQENGGFLTLVMPRPPKE